MKFLDRTEKQQALYTVINDVTSNLTNVSALLNILRDNVFERTADGYLNDKIAHDELFRVLDDMETVFFFAAQKISESIALLNLPFWGGHLRELENIKKDICEFEQLEKTFKDDERRTDHCI